ncbi:MAG: Gfo/Idh/MocA family oxidoreductase [Rhodospirillaceae bacterium]|nr:Gfo/Idh/MocA family oxidoreductase [Rhodospirillaceae bacterium]
MLNAAVIGLGWWGKILTQTLAPSDKITVVKLLDVDAEGSAAFAAEHGIDFTTDFAAVLADDNVDAVILATPHSLHEEQIIAAAGAGKHIFCEKPFCLTRASALRAMEAVEKAGVQVAIGHERRFEPPIMDAMALARDGKLGALMHIEANFSHDIFAVLDDTNWRLKTDESPAGGLTATLIHLMDLSISLFGQPDRVLASVECHGDVVKNGDTLTAQVKFENGRTASLNAFTHTPFFSRLAIFGANGWVEVRGKAHVQAPEGWFFTTCFTDGKAETVEYEVATPVLSNLECFADAIAGKADYPNTPEQIVRNVSLLEAIVKSATTDELVRIER